MLNPVEEAKHAKLREMCRELRVPPPPEIHIGLQVHDRNGVLIFDDRQRGHSWTRNFYNFMMGTLSYCHGDGTGQFGAGKMSVKNTAGSILSSSTLTCALHDGSSAAAGMRPAAAESGWGILIGTGDTAFSADHVALAAAIAHGTGSGQMSYGAMTVPAAAYTAGTKTWKTTNTRIFNNNSGALITLKETGLFYKSGNTVNYMGWFGGDAGGVHMIERSVLSPTVAVANGAQLTVTYEISMDFSAID